MIINKLEKDTYQIKIIGQTIDVYNPIELEKITHKIFQKINKGKSSIVLLDFYTDNQYGTIITKKNYNTLFNLKNEIEVKITIHTDSPFLYQMEYFDIKKLNPNNHNVYYYKDKFYLKLNKDIEEKDYLKILEYSQVIYEDTFDIIENGIKINP